MAKRHWLMKTEPDTFSIDDLARVKVEPWTGVRNFQARNLMRDGMQVGDDVLFYHSSCEPPGVAGLARVVRTGVVDETQFDPKSKYFDEGARREDPRWLCVDVEFVEKFPALVALATLRDTAALADMALLRRGMRLSVQPVTPAEYKTIVQMARKPAKKPADKPAATSAARRTTARTSPRRSARRA